MSQAHEHTRSGKGGTYQRLQLLFKPFHMHEAPLKAVLIHSQLLLGVKSQSTRGRRKI